MRPFHRVVGVGVLVVGLVTFSAACGGDDNADPATTTATSASTTPTTASTQPTTTPTAPPTTAPATVAPTVPVTAPPTTEPPTTTSPTTSPPTLVDVKLYFLRDERLAISHREVAGPAVLRESIAALLAGPNPTEAGADLISTIPSATQLLDVNLADGTATIDLSNEFGDGGGTLSVTTRVAEVVFTATQFPNVDRVQFWMDGSPFEYLSGEGLVMTDPWDRTAVSREISGSVLIDTPTPGATVGRSFTVTGEGDVFEAQFPIEVWRDGVMIGGIAPVTAGAWGQWADFEVTITVDADPGPIELVAYDEGGCGDAPECPEIIKTVVPLILTD